MVKVQISGIHGKSPWFGQMLSRDYLSFLLRSCLDSWNCPKTCSSYLIHPPQNSFSSLLSATLTPLTRALLPPSGLRSTHKAQVYLDRMLLTSTITPDHSAATLKTS